MNEVKPKHIASLHSKLKKLEEKSIEEVKKLKSHIKSLENLIKKELKSELSKLQKALDKKS